MAVKTINQKITLSGGDEIARSLRELANLGEETFRRLADAAKKIDVNLPVDQVKRQLQDLAQTGQQAFARLGQAAQQAGQQIATIGTVGTQSMQQLSGTTNAAAGSVTTLASVLNSVPGRIAIVSAAIAGLATAWTSMAKSASEAVLSIGRGADKAGVSIEQFSRSRTLLQQLGLEAGDAEAIIKRLGDVTRDAMGNAQAALGKFGVRFAPIRAGAKDATTAMAEFAMTGQQVSDRTRQMAENLQQLARITVNGKSLFDDATRAVLQFGLAFDPLTGKTQTTSQQLVLLAEAFQKIKDPALRAKLANDLFGQSLGKLVTQALGQGTDAVVKLLNQIDRLRLNVTEADRKVGKDFMLSWNLLKEVLKANNRELGLLIAKPLTPFIERFAEAMRRSAATLELYKTALKALQPVLDDILKLMEGRRTEVKLEWILEAEKQLRQLGEAAKLVFFGVIVPALETVRQGASELAKTFNQTFGTNLTGSMLLVGAGLTALIGGFKTLGLVALAAFASTDKGLNPVQEALASLGINVEELKQDIVKAWEEIKAAFAGFDIGQALRDFIQSIPGIVIAIGGVILFLNRWIGVNNLARIAVLHLSGALDVITKGFQIFFLAVGGFLGILKILEFAVLGIAAAFGISGLAATGWLAGAVIAIGILIYNIDLVLTAIMHLNKAGFGTAELLGASFGALAAAILLVSQRAQQAALAMLALGARFLPVAAAITAVLMLMQDLGIVTSESAKKMAALENEMEKINKQAARGEIPVEEANRRIQELIRKQEQLVDETKKGPTEIASEWQRKVDEILAQMQRIPEGARTAGDAAVNNLKGAAGKISGGFREVSPGMWVKIVEDGKAAANTVSSVMNVAAEKTSAGFERVGGHWVKIEADGKKAAATITDAFKNAKQVVDAAFADPKLGKMTGDIAAMKAGLERAAGEARKLDQNLDNLSIPPAVQRFIDEGLPEFEGQIEDRRGEGPPAGQFEPIVEQVQFALDSIEGASREAWDFIVEHAEHSLTEIGRLAKDWSRYIAAQLEGIAFVDPFQPLVAQAQNAVNFILQIFAQLKLKLDELAQRLQQLGSGGAAPDKEGGDQLAGLVGFGQQLVVGMEQALSQVQMMISTAIQNIGAAFSTLTTIMLQPFYNLPSGVDQIMSSIRGVVDAGFGALSSSIASAAAAVQAAIAQIIASLQAAVAEAQALAAAAREAAAAAASAGGGDGFARGGYTGDVGTRRVAGVVHGGEYVQPAHVVRQPGVRAFLETLRRVGDLREAIRRFSRGFSVGGFVDGLSSRMASALVPGFATGGLVPQPAGVASRRDLGVLRLEAGGETLQVLADETTAFKLQRFARRQKMTAGGRVPVWER